MKNLKKMISVLSAVMVMSTCAVSAVYADEAVTEPTENGQGVTNTDNIIAADAPAIKAINVRTAAYIAYALAKDYEFTEDCFDYYDYNKDGKVNVRDAASIVIDLSKKSIE